MDARPGAIRRIFPLVIVILIAAAAARFDLVGRVAYAVERGRIKAEAEQLTAVDSQDVASLENLSRAYARVAAVVRPSVVNIKAFSEIKAPPSRIHRLFGDRDLSPGFAVGTGSGVVIDNSGHIVTNNHVAGDAERLQITLSDGRQFKGKLVGTDKMTDVCVIKIDADRLHAASFGDSDAAQVGDIVLAVGSPFRLDQTVSHGIISALGRNVESLDIDYQGFIQTDAPINPGNSGGPLVNSRGQVIGINTAIATESGGYQGVGFSIPSNKVRQIAEQLIGGKKIVRGYLGVGIQPVEPATAEALGLESPIGALINGVLPDSPAARGGIKSGDIILEMDGKAIHRYTELTDYIGSTKPNTVVRFTIMRDEKRTGLSMTVGEQPEGFTTRPRSLMQPSRGGSEESDDEELPVMRGQPIEGAGMEVVTLTPEMADHLRLKGVESGAVVVGLSPAGEAWTSGLRLGEVIVSVDKKKIRSARDLNGALTSAALSKGVRLTVRTANGSRTVYLKAQ